MLIARTDLWVKTRFLRPVRNRPGGNRTYMFCQNALVTRPLSRRRTGLTKWPTSVMPTNLIDERQRRRMGLQQGDDATGSRLPVLRE